MPFVAAASLLISGAEPQAQSDSRTLARKALGDAVKQACPGEIAANCAGTDIGTGLIKCLRAKPESLSDGCKAALPHGPGLGAPVDAVAARRKALGDRVKQACPAEIAANCAGTDIGTGLIKCLRAKPESLSDGCKAALPHGPGLGAPVDAVAARRKALGDRVKQACPAEIAANCAGMDIGTGLIKCLRANPQSLSDACKAVMPGRINQ